MASRRLQSACFPSPAQTDLLRACLHEGAPAREAFARWRAAADPEAPDDGTFRLLPLLARRAPRLDAGDPLLDRWRGIARRAFVLHELLLRDAGKALLALTARGLEPIVLKGAALAASGLSDGISRPMGDLDVLVAPGHALAALEVLRAAGLQPLARHPECLVAVRHSTPLRLPSGREVDLHWRLLWESAGPDPEAPLRAAALEGKLGAIAVRAPCGADQLLHACVHGLQSAGGPSIRWAHDAYVLAGARGPFAVDWERLAREAVRRRVVLPVRTALRWVATHLDAAVPVAALARLEALPVSPAERRELLAKLRPMRGLSSLRVYWANCRRAHEREGLPGALLAFPRYLQHNWEQESIMGLLRMFAERGLRHLAGRGPSDRPSLAAHAEGA